ncbi:chemotaxis protein CheR [Verticiella sediminum]|uniref:Chemotaxis protein methyltransferase n=1 Tax=Verticiella sediminum TaxID=1247510 RepID=A0A556ATJ6_9BURK|nr:CheR family methyltransferase [Verticiella sediminum]TSH95695.1 chemotaxis protein CheR [Verticiella sediminum]
MNLPGMPSRIDRNFVFTDADFARVRHLIRERAGIALGAHKREMVYSRLSRRLRSLSMHSFTEYLDGLEASAVHPEWEAFVNALTTNLTAFFREPHHFPVLAEFVRGLGRPVNVWCAAASTGEEPYSIAITLLEALGPHAARSRVYASDIDTQVLDTARAGVYSAERVAKMEAARLQRFFLKGTGPRAGMVRVKPEVAALVEFERVNLLDERWALPCRFDAVFCRNVMIYFDKPTQARILARMEPWVEPGGLLFAGHSENLTYVTQAFVLRGQTVYQRV